VSSITKHLPIYKTTYALLQVVMKGLKHFSRDLRPTLGNRLLNEVLRLITASYRQRAGLCRVAAAYGHPVDPEHRKVMPRGAE